MLQKLQQIHKPSLPGEEFWKRKNISLFVSTASHYMNVKLKLNLPSSESDFLKFFSSFKSVETNITVIAFHFFEVICCLNLLEMKFIHNIS